MRAVKEPPAYRVTRAMSHANGPVRRPFAILAIACAILVAAVIVLAGNLG